MDTSQPLPLLGGLSPQQFMRRHWQKMPLLVRQAIPHFEPLLSAAELFALAGREEVESRLVTQEAGRSPRSQVRWQLHHGPFKRRSLPPLRQPGWTLLVQGVDLHHAGAHELLQRFRFLPDARLDDLMISIASEGGGVGPHFDSYDVFLLQASGSRRWRISAQTDLSLREGLPLKILRRFSAQQEFVLHAGDMLYLPPRYAHDGVAVGRQDAACMTYSIGFRAPAQHELASAMLTRLAENMDEAAAGVTARLYRDPHQPACDHAAALPAGMIDFARHAVERALRDPKALVGALGQYLSEPKPGVWFEPGDVAWRPGCGLRLHARTRMLYEGCWLFINGEKFVAGGVDARLLRVLADDRFLEGDAVRRLSPQARAIVLQWLADGWLEVQAISS